MVEYLKEESKWSTDVEVEVVVRFVDPLWHTNVGFQGTKDITDSMVILRSSIHYVHQYYNTIRISA